jgi:putative glutathione S-transferase
MIFTARVLFFSCWCRSINMKHIKEHYFTSHPSLNTYAIVPVGGKAWWEEPHNRGA